ncbi:unnamed protein product [Amaranthus hypochondriacus]
MSSIDEVDKKLRSSAVRFSGHWYSRNYQFGFIKHQGAPQQSNSLNPVQLLYGSPATAAAVWQSRCFLCRWLPGTWVVLQCAVRAAASLFDIVFLDATYWVESPAGPDCLILCCGALPIRFLF